MASRTAVPERRLGGRPHPAFGFRALLLLLRSNDFATAVAYDVMVLPIALRPPHFPFPLAHLPVFHRAFSFSCRFYTQLIPLRSPAPFHSYYFTACSDPDLAGAFAFLPPPTPSHDFETDYPLVESSRSQHYHSSYLRISTTHSPSCTRQLPPE